jgi:uncharacterized protein
MSSEGAAMTADDGAAAIRAAAARVAAAGQSGPRPAPDAVNLPMIRHWVQAMGDENPLYTDAGYAAGSGHGELVAPPAMIQVWTMRGLRPAVEEDGSDPLGLMVEALDGAGYTSVVATNSEQEYLRYLRHGERLTVRTSLEEVTGPKRTSLGEGWFVTTLSTWYSGTEPVGSMRFRVLKFRPAPARAPLGDPIRPAISRDTEFFWDGTARHELRIQRCGECGALRHPPGPACQDCAAAKPDYVVAAGTGEVYSYVVHHHPPVPGRLVPFVVALVQLPEGVRMVGELVGSGPGQVHIGMPVEVSFVPVDDELTLPAWRPLRPGQPAAPPPAEAAASGPAEPPGQALPELVIDVTPTRVIAGAIATRDYQDVHHDRDAAVRRGSKDIFVNILTTTGLVQRYVTDWAGPHALVRGVAIRLGVPCYAGDTLTFSGRAVRDEAAGELVVRVTGRCSLGDHVTGTVRIVPAGGAS